jgi:hypothetical protein
MKISRKLEATVLLGTLTLYVGLAHVAAREHAAHALLAAGRHSSPWLVGFVLVLVALRLLVVVVVPGVVVARLVLLGHAWTRDVRDARRNASVTHAPFTSGAESDC